VGALFGRSRKGADAADPGDPARAYPLEELLENMHDLRMTLAVDLTAAAGAADAGADDVARDIIEADRRELARFARVAGLKLANLDGESLADEPRPVRREPSPWRRRVVTALPVVPVVGAMALSAAAATGVLQLPGTGPAPAHHAAIATNDASPVTSFKQLVNVLNSDPSASQVIAAASKLHRQLSQLIAVSSNDPSQAAEVARLLQMEQSLLMREQPPGVSVVLNATRQLAARLVTVVPSTTPSITPTFVPTPQPSAHHPHRAVASTPPTPAAPAQSPSPTPTATATPSANPSNRPDTSPSANPSQFPRIPR